MSSAFPALTCDDVRYRHTSGQHAFSFNFQVSSPQFIRILGKSGAGKSTLLALLGGFLAPQSGKVQMGEQNITKLHPHRRKMGFLFQSNNLFYHLTVFQNVALGISPSLKLSQQDEQKVYEILKDLQILELAQRKAQDLSGGQQQRVAIARCFVQEKSYLLLDEPFASLDLELRKELIYILAIHAKIKQQSILMVTHFPEELEAVSHRTLLVQDSTIKEI
ncbi:MAG: ATP-binding cassette domain-containing protein [Alphaproteobacteria bacterium]